MVVVTSQGLSRRASIVEQVIWEYGSAPVVGRTCQRRGGTSDQRVGLLSFFFSLLDNHDPNVVAFQTDVTYSTGTTRTYEMSLMSWQFLLSNRSSSATGSYDSDSRRLLLGTYCKHPAVWASTYCTSPRGRGHTHHHIAPH